MKTTYLKQKMILQEQFNARIESSMTINRNIFEKIEKEGSMLRDFLAPIGSLAGNKQVINFHSNGKLKMKVLKGEYEIGRAHV